MSLFGEYLEENNLEENTDMDNTIEITEAEYNAVMEAREALEEAIGSGSMGGRGARKPRTTKEVKKFSQAALKLDSAAKEQEAKGNTKTAAELRNAAANVGAQIKSAKVGGKNKPVNASSVKTKAANAVKTGGDNFKANQEIRDKKKAEALEKLAKGHKNNPDIKKILALVAAGVLTVGAATIAIKKIKAAQAQKKANKEKKATNESIEMTYIDDDGIEESVELTLEEFAAIMEFKSEDEDPFVMNEAEYTAYNNYKADQILEALNAEIEDNEVVNEEDEMIELSEAEYNAIMQAREALK